MHKYERIIYQSNTDNCFIADVPELHRFMSDGETAKVITSEWIKTAKENGREVPEPRPSPCSYLLV